MIQEMFTAPPTERDELIVFDLEGLFPAEVSTIRSARNISEADAALCQIQNAIPECADIPEKRRGGLVSWIRGLRHATFAPAQLGMRGENLNDFRDQ